jgi:hypothetical protein
MKQHVYAVSEVISSGRGAAGVAPTEVEMSILKALATAGIKVVNNCIHASDLDKAIDVIADYDPRDPAKPPYKLKPGEGGPADTPVITPESKKEPAPGSISGKFIIDTQDVPDPDESGCFQGDQYTVDGKNFVAKGLESAFDAFYGSIIDAIAKYTQVDAKRRKDLLSGDEDIGFDDVILGAQEKYEVTVFYDDTIEIKVLNKI